MTQKISGYPNELTALPSDEAVGDFSFDDGGGFDTYKVKFKHIKGISVVAEILSIDMGSTTTGDEFIIPWICSGKRTTPKWVEITNITAGKAPQILTIQIGSFSGGDDIMKPETMFATFSGSSTQFSIEGTVSHMLSDSAFYYAKIVVGASNAYTGDIIIHASHQDA
jgi:hypothetical protein